MIGYAKCFDSNKTMSFNVIDKKLLIKKYSKIWEGVSNSMNIDKNKVIKNKDKNKDKNKVIRR